MSSSASHYHPPLVWGFGQERPSANTTPNLAVYRPTVHHSSCLFPSKASGGGRERFLSPVLQMRRPRSNDRRGKMTEIPQPESGQDWKRFQGPSRVSAELTRGEEQTPRVEPSGMQARRGPPRLVGFGSLTGQDVRAPTSQLLRMEPHGGVHPSAGPILNSSLTIDF